MNKKKETIVCKVKKIDLARLINQLYWTLATEGLRQRIENNAATFDRLW